MNRTKIEKYMKTFSIMQLLGVASLLGPTILVFDEILNLNLFNLTEKAFVILFLIGIMISLSFFSIVIFIMFKVNKTIGFRYKKILNIENYSTTIDNPLLEVIFIGYYITFKYKKIVNHYLLNNGTEIILNN